MSGSPFSAAPSLTIYAPHGYGYGPIPGAQVVVVRQVQPVVMCASPYGGVCVHPSFTGPTSSSSSTSYYRHAVLNRPPGW